MTDNVNHPKHYAEQAACVEPHLILRHAPFYLGNALKYIIRAGHKLDEQEDLQKARWYLKKIKRTYKRNPEHYDEFVKYFGDLLPCFKALRSIDPDAGLLWQLEELVNERLKVN